MLKEAQEEDDKTGLSRCYNIMSQIYTIKRFDSMAFEWRLKEIELTEKIQDRKLQHLPDLCPDSQLLHQPEKAKKKH